VLLLMIMNVDKNDCNEEDGGWFLYVIGIIHRTRAAITPVECP